MIWIIPCRPHRSSHIADNEELHFSTSGPSARSSQAPRNDSAAAAVQAALQQKKPSPLTKSANQVSINVLQESFNSVLTQDTNQRYEINPIRSLDWFLLFVLTCSPVPVKSIMLPLWNGILLGSFPAPPETMTAGENPGRRVKSMRRCLRRQATLLDKIRDYHNKGDFWFAKQCFSAIDVNFRP